MSDVWDSLARVKLAGMFSHFSASACSAEQLASWQGTCTIRLHPLTAINNTNPLYIASSRLSLNSTVQHCPGHYSYPHLRLSFLRPRPPCYFAFFVHSVLRFLLVTSSSLCLQSLASLGFASFGWLPAYVP